MFPILYNKVVLEPQVSPAFAITHFWNHCNIWYLKQKYNYTKQPHDDLWHHTFCTLFLLKWLHLCYFFIHVQSFNMCHCGFVKFCWCNLNPKMMDCLGMVSVLAFIFRPTPSTFVTIFSTASCVLLKFIHWTSLHRLWYQGVIRAVQINGCPDGSSNSSSMMITTRSPTFNSS